MSIEIRNVSKRFGSFQAVKDVSLDIPTGELVALMGPSGSGKTTLLRIIAGLEFSDQGTVLFQGKDATDRRARERNVGFVFQHYALFKHMSVFENVAFGLKVRSKKLRPSDREIKEKVDALLKLILLERMANRYPSQLSGGQRQRVALARALAVEPNVLLLDEPFGALDAKVRKELRRWLRKLHDELHVTSVFVTHDQEEALEVADRVVVMNEGRIEQIGTPDDVYHHPVNSFVYNFLGSVNLFHCRIEGGKAYFGNMAMELPKDARPDAKVAQIYVRPHLLDISMTPPHANSLQARVRHINPAGPVVRIEVVSEQGDSLQVEISHERYQSLQIQKNNQVFVFPREIKVFSDDYSIYTFSVIAGTSIVAVAIYVFHHPEPFHGKGSTSSVIASRIDWRRSNLRLALKNPFAQWIHREKSICFSIGIPSAVPASKKRCRPSAFQCLRT